MTLVVNAPASGEAAPYESLAALRAAHGALLKRYHGAETGPALLDDAERFLGRGRATGALLDAEGDRWAAQSLLDYWLSVLFRAGREPPDASLAEFDPSLAPHLDDAACPYVGLDAFQENNRAVFYGRRRLVERLVARVKGERLLAVVGSSGSGKSSVVLAGLLPALKDGSVPGSGGWRYVRPLVPGTTPVAHLVRVLLPQGADETWVTRHVEAVERDPSYVVDMAGGTAGQPVVLTVDQFEEVFTLCDEGARRPFVEALVRLVEAPGARHTVVLTMRSDFETHVARLPALHALFEKGQERMTPLGAAELREAIEEPAERVGLKFGDGVVEALVGDILGEPAALPLLQFTLLKLWEHRERNRITWEAYRRLGGGRRALERSADELFESLIPEEQVTARRILLRLVRPSGGLEVTSGRMRREALHATGEDPGRVERVLAKLIRARLVRATAGDEATGGQVEVAHEALARNWGRLVGWLEEERASMVRRRRLEAKAAEWVRLGRGNAGLLDAVQVRETKDWLESPDAAELGYDEALPALVAASERAIGEAEREAEAGRQRELAQARALAAEQSRRASEQSRSGRRLALLAVALAAVALLAIVAASAAVAQQRLAAARAAEARTAQATAEARRAEVERLRQVGVVQVLAGQAVRQQAQLIKEDERAALLARQAFLFSERVQRQALDQADDALRTALSKPYFNHIMRGPPGGREVLAVAFSPRGEWLAAGSVDATIWLWDMRQPGAAPRVLRAHEGEVRSLAFDPDGAWLVTAGGDMTLRLWDLGTPAVTPITPTELGSGETDVASVAFHPDGKTVASGHADGVIRLWDVNRPAAPAALLPSGAGDVRSVAISRDGRWLAAAHGDDGAVRLWDLSRSGAGPTLLRGHLPRVNAVAFATAPGPEGLRLASGSDDGTIRVWEVGRPGADPMVLSGHDAGVNSVAISADGRQLVSGSTDATVRVWDLERPGAAMAVLRGHKYVVRGVALSEDGAWLASGSEDRTVWLWDRRPPPSAPPTVLTHDAGINPMAASRDGRWLAAGVGNGSVRLMDLGQRPETLAAVYLGHTQGVRSLAFTPDGSMLASASDDTTVRLWNVREPAAPERVLAGHTGRVWSVRVSADGRLLASASRDGTVRLWDLSTAGGGSRVLGAQGELGQEPLAADFSPDGRWLAVGSAAGGVRMVNLSQPDSAPIELGKHDAEVRSLAFSPNGAWLATASMDNTVRLWDVGRAAQPRPAGVSEMASTVLRGHASAVQSVVFGRSGAWLASASEDGTARLWELARPGAPPMVLRGHEGWVNSVAFAADDASVFTGSRDGSVRRWIAPTQMLADLVCARVWRNLTLEEWQQFVGGDIPYERTCTNLPPGDGA